MRTMTWAMAALVVAFTMGCEDRERTDRIDAAGEEAGEEIRQGTDEVGEAVEDVSEDVAGYSYDRRDEFRRDMRDRFDRLDRELGQLESELDEDASEAHRQAVASARDARGAVERDFERLGDVTADNWDEVSGEVSESLDALERQLRELRPDANPMGGAGPT